MTGPSCGRTRTRAPSGTSSFDGPLRDELHAVEEHAVEDVVAAELAADDLAAAGRVGLELEQLGPDQHLDGAAAPSSSARGRGRAASRRCRPRAGRAGSCRRRRTRPPSGWPARGRAPRAPRPGRSVPSRISAIRSASENASSRSCVTRTTVTPIARRIAGELVAHRGAQVRVDVRPRLVEQHELGLGRERARERDALLLPARELVRVAAAEPAEADERRAASAHACPALAARERRSRRSRRPSGAGRARSPGRPSRRVRRSGGTHVPLPATGAPATCDRAGVRLLEAGDQAQQRRLAAAGRAEEGDELAALDAELRRRRRPVTAPYRFETPWKQIIPQAM